jgi:hypothetical protein
MARLTPQEKKRLSYLRDRRNVYGEAPHAARKGIPLRKALRNRANRRYRNQQLEPLEHLGLSPGVDLLDEIESSLYHRAPNMWKKDADAPLGEVVAKKLRDREVMRGAGGRRTLQTRYGYDAATGKLVRID